MRRVRGRAILRDMAGGQVQITLNSEHQTAQTARALGAALRPGDTVLLSGDIGAGKTALARALIQSLQDVAEDVPSPTFTLVQVYDTKSGEVWHSDLYRLSTPQDVVELGLADAFQTAICLIEWPDRLGDLAPPDALHIHLTIPDPSLEMRQATLTWSDPRWSFVDGLALELERPRA